MKKVNQDVHNYIITQINPFIEPLVTELVRKRPANPMSYSINWMVEREKRKQSYRSRKVIESDTEEECRDEVRELSSTTEKKKIVSRRICMADESFGDYNDKAELELTQTENLTKEDRTFLKEFMHSSILFQNLDSKDQEIIMKAMTIKETHEYEVIVKEGEPGNNYYIIAEGEFDCYKLSDGENFLVKTYRRGDSFGELALMYNAPRAASILSNNAGKLFILDRSIFSHILKVAALRKQIIIKQAIDKVEILKSIPPDQKYNLIDLLKQETYSKGQYVIREGEPGQKFYIVLEGKLAAEKMNQQGQSSVVWQYGQGDYFGELALINNQPRQASIRSCGVSKLAVVCRQGFKKVFGGIEQTLKQTTHKYHE